MSCAPSVPTFLTGRAFHWRTALLDTMLACAGSLLVTGVIFAFQLYPRIPNISIIYLLLVLSLASSRGRYASILASLVAFLSFDFFIVPPLYTFVIYHVEEWIALFVFLTTAIITSQMAVTLRQRAEERARLELLQRTDELRAALLTSVSHDLRTPLTIIKASATSLLQDDVEWDDEVRQSFMRSIEHEVDRLNRLVGNLLDMSRIEGGALKPEKEWYPLTVLVRDVLRRLQPLMLDRSVLLSLPNELTTVELDYVLIDQVLTNLLENALRYTPPTSPLEVSMEFGGASVLLGIADRGPGIPATELEHVFDTFYRVRDRQPQAGYSSGSGLGLAICKGIVEAHGGRIWAEARKGGGVVFYLSLPLAQAEKCAPSYNRIHSTEESIL